MRITEEVNGRTRLILKFWTGEDDDPQGQLRATQLAELGIPEERIHFGDSSHREFFEYLKRKMNQI